MLSGEYSFENEKSTSNERKKKKNIQLYENIMNKYNN